ncbi:GtrA family protein [Streptococcus sp. X16XC17]|uniref:GtrA family protein n=1 Tax=unclassified Streptococcus TaxID=2608887 RepID=UPI00066FF4DD|nr:MULTISPECIES: GtrA family protein [unclassified Streptococcus]TCD46158.1 GtrA family protein [Streptococcus sp. X16XC17]
MKHLKKLLQNEVFLYLVFGVATTLVYIATRTILFAIIPQTLLVVFIANCVAITFAFFTNDRIVFKQKSSGWLKRMIKFVLARISTLFLDMVLAYIFVDAFPQIIGQFVGHDIQKVNAVATLISQVLVIVFNYVLSKLFVFTAGDK